VYLKGKCRYCKKPISWQYPVVELITAALFVKSYYFWPYASGGNWSISAGILFGIWCVLLTLFMALTIYDLRWMLLPDKLVFVVIGLSALFVGVRLVTSSNPATVFLDSFYGLLSVGGLFYVLFQASKGKWIGGGDVKIGFGLGLLAGSLLNGFLLIFVASCLGTIVALPLLLTGKKALTGKLAFGPFLMAATVFVVLFGPTVTDWYQRLFLI
jgi:prepilin signal peptidase PulO-like enzyme (type II secretory pathway)